MLDASFSHLGL